MKAIADNLEGAINVRIGTLQLLANFYKNDTPTESDYCRGSDRAYLRAYSTILEWLKDDLAAYGAPQEAVEVAGEECGLSA